MKIWPMLAFLNSRLYTCSVPDLPTAFLTCVFSSPVILHPSWPSQLTSVPQSHLVSCLSSWLNYHLLQKGILASHECCCFCCFTSQIAVILFVRLSLIKDCEPLEDRHIYPFSSLYLQYGAKKFHTLKTYVPNKKSFIFVTSL